jgi:hypothetical protein
MQADIELLKLPRRTSTNLKMCLKFLSIFCCLAMFFVIKVEQYLGTIFRNKAINAHMREKVSVARLKEQIGAETLPAPRDRNPQVIDLSIF